MLLLFVAIPGILSQSMISGVVTDAKSGSPLPFSTIAIKSTTTGTTTDLNGGYNLPLSPGNYALVASFLGYQNQEKQVVIDDEKNVTVNFELTSESIMGEEIVVTGMLLGQKSAISSQLNAAGIVNAVSEEQIQELPDANAGDALGRLPGISLKRSGGEAQNIVLRGLNEKFSMIQLNGVAIPSTGGESRGVDLSLFSLNSMAGIEVTKALTPDMDADAIAGAVNLVTKKASKEPKLRIDLGGGYNMLENSANQYNAGLRYNRRLFNDFLGLQASVTGEKRIRSNEKYSQNWAIAGRDEPIISDFILTYSDESRKRLGGSLLLDISTPDQGTIRFNNFYNRTDRDAVVYSRSYIVSTQDVNYKIQDSERDIQTINNSLSGENFLKKIKITWGGAHALSIGNTGYDHSLQFYEGGTTTTGIKNYPKDILNGPGELVIPYGHDNFREAFLYLAYFEPSKSKDQDYTAYLNLERNLELTNNINISLKTGAKYKYKNRINNKDVFRSPYWVNQPKDYSLLEDGSIVPSDYSNTSFANLEMVGGTNVSMANFLANELPNRELFSSKFSLYPLLDQELAREWYATHNNGVSSDGSLKEYSLYHSGLMRNYEVSEKVSAGYAMATINLGKMIRIIGGIRIEQEENRYLAKYAPEITNFFTFDESSVLDTINNYTATYILPNLHVKFKPTDWFDLRCAATKTLARPDFTMRLPTLVVDRVNRTINRGNSFLNNTEAWNYDVIASFYKSKYGLFTVSGFMKKMDNVFYMLNDVRILNSEMAEDYSFPQGYGTYVGFILNEPQNTNNTEVKGLEFDLQANLKFLPGFLGNFILRGNFTAIKSVTYIPRYNFETDESVFPPTLSPVFYESEETLEGQPSKFGNIALGYDKGGFSGRLSVFFQGDYVNSVSSNKDLDVLQKGYSKWDLALKQEIEKFNMEVMLNISNISNMQEGTYYRFHNLDKESSIYNMLIDLGLRITL